ncbi:MAG: metallophosphoesterase [Candidatus Aenigmarchaeota archaeon]|nr:metallophosphoesterase [Candidatus Aenigmarchaeota archaeon]
MRFLTERALLIDKTLVIADLHIGMESALYHSGISIPSQIQKLENKINKLSKQTKAKQLIILGDLKHKVPGTYYQESIEIPAFLERLSEKLEVIVVKGNHDADLHNISDVKIISSKGIKIGNYGFVHGHAWFSKKLLDCEYLIMGHVHPAVEFKGRMKEHCWIKAELDTKAIEKKYKKKCKIKEIIIMPAFNPIIGGMAFNKENYTLMGPIMNVIKLEESKVYLLDGTYIGKLKKLLNNLD